MLVFALFPESLSAASFNCANAHSPVESLICANPELGELDEKLAHQYALARENAANESALIDEQRAWLFTRNRCYQGPGRRVVYRANKYPSDWCLKRIYIDRIAELRMRYVDTDVLLGDVLDALRRSPDVEVTAYGDLDCTRLLEDIKSATTLAIVNPSYKAFSLQDEEIKRVLGSCELEKLSSISISQKQTFHGDGYMSETGRVWSPYDDNVLWRLPEDDGRAKWLLGVGPFYYDSRKSLEDGVIGPHWASGKTLYVISQNPCELTGATIAPFTAKYGVAPSERERPVVLDYDARTILLAKGMIFSGENYRLFKVRVDEVKESFRRQCTYSLHDRKGNAIQ